MGTANPMPGDQNSAVTGDRQCIDAVLAAGPRRPFSVVAVELSNPAPRRTPGASITGAAGTEVARTPFGTSDRTPSNHYRPGSF